MKRMIAVLAALNWLYRKLKKRREGGGGYSDVIFMHKLKEFFCSSPLTSFPNLEFPCRPFPKPSVLLRNVCFPSSTVMEKLWKRQFQPLNCQNHFHTV